jgi:hypothetical protein
MACAGSERAQIVHWHAKPSPNTLSYVQGGEKIKD